MVFAARCHRRKNRSRENVKKKTAANKSEEEILGKEERSAG